MKEKLKKLVNRNVFSIGVIILLGFAAFASAGGLSGQINIENVERLEINNPPLGNIADEDLSLGSGAYTEDQDDMATSTLDLADMGGLSIFDRLRFGDEPATDNNSVTYKYAYKDFTDATATLFAIQVQESDGASTNPNVFIDEIMLQLDGMPTTTIQMFVGTSSSQYVNYTNTIVGTGNIAGGPIGLMDNVLVTDGGLYDATNTVFSSYDSTFAPPNLGYGTDERAIPITPGAWIVGVASTTDGDAGDFYTGDLFDGKVFIRYKIVK
ncbi:MAG: hypothetical protein ACOZAL_01090 [Patescibacteria group bacterium]